MDKIAEVLKQLADKLGTTVEHLWGVLVRQAGISFWADVVFYVVAVVIIVVAAKVLAHCVRRCKALWLVDADKYSMSDETEARFVGNVVTGAISTVLILIFGIVMLCSVEDTITKRYNPEYWALEQVTQMLKQ